MRNINNIMAQYLIIGDSHIPRRAKDIPAEMYDKITEFTSTELFEYTFFTGDEINAPKFMEFLNLSSYSYWKYGLF